jgi:hypothetical protein
MVVLYSDTKCLWWVTIVSVPIQFIYLLRVDLRGNQALQQYLSV